MPLHRFILTAPTCRRAWLELEADDWQRSEMERSPEGRWQQERELPPGTYRYRYVVESASWTHRQGEIVTVVDPRAAQVDGDVGVLQVIDAGERRFPQDWAPEDRPLPSNHDLVIYELCLRTFSAGEGPAATRALQRLDHLAELGIKAIQLLPITGNRGGFGYLTRHFFAPDPSYGSPEEVADLIAGCHARGIRVFMDLVANHASTDCPLVHIDHDYWFHHEPLDPENAWGPQFDYDQHADGDGRPALDFMLDAVRHWVSGYHLDGLRIDAARQVDRFEVLGRLAETGRDAAGIKPFLAIGEWIPVNPEATGPEGPLDTLWNDTFQGVIAALLRDRFEPEEIARALDPRLNGFPSPRNAINYLASHDNGHLMDLLAAAGVYDEAAFARARLGFALLLTAPGTPQIWMGDEFGAYGGDDQPLDWDLPARSQRNRDLIDLVRGLITLRGRTAALTGEEIDLLAVDGERRLVAYQRWDEAGGRVVVVANAGEAAQTFTWLDAAPGRWREWIQGSEHQVDHGLELTLGGWQAMVLIHEP
jgi:1,4-alpha-glucan branching enzyme